MIVKASKFVGERRVVPTLADVNQFALEWRISI